MTMYGDGSANQGQLFEASNMAGLWKLPVIFCVENNKYGMGTSVERASHQTSLMGKFRGFPGIKVDGMDVFAVREVVKVCKEYSIQNGPMFLELETYRYQGHSMSDPGITYRTKEEVTKVRSTVDCIEKIRKHILDHSLATDEELKGIEKDIRAKVEEDVEKIKKDPLPKDSELYSDVYKGTPPPFIRGIELKDSIVNEK